MQERPNGSHAITIGWLVIAIGLVALLVTVGAETFEGMLWGALIANLGIGLGVLLVSLGYLVRAIWFLPGREIEIAEFEKGQGQEERSDGFHYCDWCHLGLYEPEIACSRQTEDEIRQDVSESTTLQTPCRTELEARGIISK